MEDTCYLPVRWITWIIWNDKMTKHIIKNMQNAADYFLKNSYNAGIDYKD